MFGYEAQHPNDARAPGEVLEPGQSWPHRNGSFLVFRRFYQDVAAFWRFLEDMARTHQDAIPGLTPDRLGALLVGRWRSGAPILRTPYSDDIDLGAANAASNRFDFTSRMPRHNDGFPAGEPDPLGLACPTFAHIRKANPRNGHTEQGGLEDTLTRRILRRGIPYGPPLRTGQQVQGDHDRGLHFLSYQTSIVGQFEFLTRAWFNSPMFPAGGGFDLLIGQDGERPRSCRLPRPDGGTVTLEPRDRWVLPTGGGYFFVPSKSTFAALA